MASLIYLTDRAPCELTDALMAAGHRVWEALSVSEVLHLCEHQNVDAVVVAPAIRDEAILPIELNRITISLESTATAADLIWELEQLFPRHISRLQ